MVSRDFYSFARVVIDNCRVPQPEKYIQCVIQYKQYLFITSRGNYFHERFQLRLYGQRLIRLLIKLTCVASVWCGSNPAVVFFHLLFSFSPLEKIRLTIAFLSHRSLFHDSVSVWSDSHRSLNFQRISSPPANSCCAECGRIQAASTCLQPPDGPVGAGSRVPRHGREVAHCSPHFLLITERCLQQHMYLEH